MSACCHAAALLSSVTLGVDVELTLEAPPLAFAAQGYCSSGCLGRKNDKLHPRCDVDRSWAVWAVGQNLLLLWICSQHEQLGVIAAGAFSWPY